jgi:beta-lactam-binding protein with PASTA domain
MEVGRRVRTIFRLLFLFAVLMTVAVVSAITTIRLTVHGRQETLPNLAGLPVAQAQTVVDGLGLNLKVEDRLYNASVPAGSIVSQMPAAGTRVKPLQDATWLRSIGRKASPTILSRRILRLPPRICRVLPLTF